MGGEFTSTPEEATKFRAEQEGPGELDMMLRTWQDRARSKSGDFVEGVTAELACTMMKQYADRLKAVDAQEELDKLYDQSREEVRRNPTMEHLGLAKQDFIAARREELGPSR